MIYVYDSLDGVNWWGCGVVGGFVEGDYSIDVVGDELVFVMCYVSNNKIYICIVNI